MKNTLKFAITALLLVFAFQFASACNSQNRQYNDMYSNDETIYIGHLVQQYSYDWENENRYPTYDYRNGYTYRITNEYVETKNNRDFRYYYDEENHHPSRVVFQKKPHIYYEYSDYMRSYQKYECYSNPPSDKLIYSKCP
jgi:hypothetical protein